MGRCSTARRIVKRARWRDHGRFQQQHEGLRSSAGKFTDPPAKLTAPGRVEQQESANLAACLASTRTSLPAVRYRRDHPVLRDRIGDFADQRLTVRPADQLRRLPLAHEPRAENPVRDDRQRLGDR